MKRVFSYIAILGATLLFIWGVFYLVTVIVPRQAVEKNSEMCIETLGKVASCVRDIFGVTPVCHDRTLTFKVQDTRAILELSTVSRTFTHYYRYSTTWMNSTKVIDLVGIYEAKAGMDLNKEIRIIVSPDGKVLDMVIPPAELHSLTKVEEGAIQEDSGIWNRITSQDKEIALQKLYADSRKTILETDLLKQAETNFFNQIRGKLENGGLGKGFQIKEEVERKTPDADSVSSENLSSRLKPQR